MFEIKNLDILVNTRYLVKDLSLTLNKGDKLAIIGEEGNGKSTFLKVLLGICNYAKKEGTVNTHGHQLGYLAQSMSEGDQQKKVFDFLFENEIDYYDNIKNFYRNLDRLHLDDSILEQKTHTLSGGEKVKVGLLKLFLEEAEILLLDEPTNDLDIETLEWLEQFINQTEQPIIYVSHDETLLSHTANMILHLEQINHKMDPRHTIVRIDYDTYVERRMKAIDKQIQVSKFEKRSYDKKQEKLRQLVQKVEYQQNTISRSDPHGARLLKKKMHSLKSQEKRLEHIDLTEYPDVEEHIYFTFDEVFIPKTKRILKLELPILQVQQKVLSKNISLEVFGSEHVCIIGKNGVGKSTLLKKIYQELKERTDIHVGYMPQVYEDILNNDDYVLEFLVPNGDKEEITKARMYLGNMKFTKEEMTGKISDLSNGSKTKLLLTKFVLEKYNVLILDEPTRNVSPLSNPVIREVLKNFGGTIISVSHDRKYIEEVTSCLYLLNKDGLEKK